MKKFFKITGFLFLFVILFIFLVILILPHLIPEEKVKAQFITLAEKKINRPLKINSFRLNVFKGIELKGVEIGNHPQFEKRPSFQVEEVVIKYKLWPLLFKKLIINKIILKKPDLFLVRNKKGEFNFQNFFKKSPRQVSSPQPLKLMKMTSDTPFSLLLSSVEITGGEIEFKDYFPTEEPAISKLENLKLKLKSGVNFSQLKATLTALLNQSPLRLELKGQSILEAPLVNLNCSIEKINLLHFSPYYQDKLKDFKLVQAEVDLELSAQLEKEKEEEFKFWPANLKLKNGLVAFQLPQLKKKLSPFEITASLLMTEKEKVAVENLKVKWQNSTLSLKAVLENFSFPKIQANPEVKIALEDLKKIFPVSEEILLAEKNLTLVSEIEYQPLEVKVPALTLTGPGLSLSARGEVRNLKTSPLVNFSVSTTQLDLAELTALLPPSLLKKTSISGQGEWKITAQGEVKKIKVQSVIKFAQISLKNPSFTEEIKNLLLEANFAPDNLKVEKAKLSFGESDILLRGSVKNFRSPLISFSLNSENLNVNDLLKLGAPVKLKKKKPISRRKPTKIKLTAEGWVYVKQGRFKKNEFKNLKCRVVFKNNILSISNLKANLYQGKVGGGFKFNLTTGQPQYNIQTNLQRMEVNQLLSANTSWKDLLFGRLIARCSFQGAGKDLRRLSGRGEIALQQGRIEECELSRSLAELLETPRLKKIPLKDLKVHFEINQGWVKTSNFTIKTEDFLLIPTGRFNLNGELDYKIKLTLPPGQVKVEVIKKYLKGIEKLNLLSRQEIIDLFKDKQGNFVLFFNLKGAFKRPALALDLTEPRKRLFQKLRQKADQKIEEMLSPLEKKIEEGLKNLFK